MLNKLLDVAGVDLQAQLAQLTARANAFKDETIQEVRAEVAHAGVTAALALTAIVALAATGVIALVAFYMWMEPRSGSLAALAAVGGITATVAVVTALIVVSRTETRKTVPFSAPVKPVVQAAPPPPRAASRPSLNLASAIPPPPPNASLYDVVAHRVTARAANAADEAIDTAYDNVAHGTRAALVGTLAMAVLVGYVVGRRGI